MAPVNRSVVSTCLSISYSEGAKVFKSTVHRWTRITPLAHRSIHIRDEQYQNENYDKSSIVHCLERSKILSSSPLVVRV